MLTSNNLQDHRGSPRHRYGSAFERTHIVRWTRCPAAPRGGYVSSPSEIYRAECAIVNSFVLLLVS